MVSIRKKIFRFFVFAGVCAAMCMNAKTVSAQCGLALKDEVMKDVVGKATYLKDFRVRLEPVTTSKKQKEEFSILLNKGTHYRFNVKADSSCTDQIILKLYDFTKFYGSNYDESDGMSYDFFDFFCGKTQVYYLSLSFAEGKEGCAAAVVSYVGNY
ncbi:MAG: hypothetical protein J6T98_10365 [Salinivirgaceae bacterium]|nr:hypothetical protein [Salinivirgaceae bacterium]